MLTGGYSTDGKGCAKDRLWISDTSSRFEHDELQAVLLEKTQSATDIESVQVDLFADKTLSYQELYRVLDIIRIAGISNVSLQSGTTE